MFSINILRFISNFSFKGDTLYRLIPSGVIDLFIPPDSLRGDIISRDTGIKRAIEKDQKSAGLGYLFTYELKRPSVLHSRINSSMIISNIISDYMHDIIHALRVLRWHGPSADALSTVT